MNALHLTALDIGKNFIKSSIGPTLKKYLETNRNLRRLNIEYNQLQPEGGETLFQGAIESSLEELNLRGNSIGDRGLARIESVFRYSDHQMDSLRVLNLASNDITREGVTSLLTIVNGCRLTCLNLSRNLLADEGVIQLITNLTESVSGELI